MQNERFDQVFSELRAVLAPYGDQLVTVHDNPGDYYLDTRHIQKNTKPLFFGAVKTGKAYVSFHLMPVYLWTELLESLSPALRKRMQGKSCFNFKTSEPELVSELAGVVRLGFNRYQREGWV